MRTAALIALMLAGCNDRTREIPPVQFEPRVDMGVDAAPDTGVPPMPDGICDDQLDGTSCEVPQGRGVCANARCVLTACESGFGDCTDEPGCETALSDPETCGGCAVSCSVEQRCAQGPTGFACAAGIVCPTDRYDLDSDPSNGCEWQAEWEAPFALTPVGLEVQAASWTTRPLLAGVDGEARVSVRLGDAPEVTMWPEPAGEARAIDIHVDEAVERVVWTDGVSLQFVGDETPLFNQPDCDPAAVPRRFVGASGDFVATQFEVFEVDETCAQGPCLQPVFGLADYHAAFSGDFGAEELVACDGCATSLDPGCWGTEQCRPVDFDDTVCGACDPTGCPTLDIVDLVQVDNQLAILTARGIVLFDLVTRDALRAEGDFDPMMSGGPRFVRATAAPGWVTVFHSTGYARVVGQNLGALAPDLGLSFDPEAASLTGWDNVLVAVHGGDAELIMPTARSGRTVFLEQSTGPQIQGIAPVAAVSTAEGARVLYQASGQLFSRRIFRP